MSDERPEESPAPRFGRRPRQANTPVPGGEPPAAVPKKVKIGPRRPDAPAPTPVPGVGSLEGGLVPRGGVRKPKGSRGKSGQNPSARDGNRPDKSGSGDKPAPRKNPRTGNRPRGDRPQSKVQKPGRENPPLDLFEPQNFEPAPESLASGAIPLTDSVVGDRPTSEPNHQEDSAAGYAGASRNARRRKRRKDRRQIPRATDSDVFEPARPFEMASSDEVSFEADDSDLNLVVQPPPSSISTMFSDTSFSDASFSDDGEGEMASEPPPSGGAAGGPPMESRSRRRRKKRRERQELPPVDRESGYWWAEQWIRSFEVLYGNGASRARLQKGRSYARRGQVTELEVGPNGVIARVQGSRPKPYQVRLELNRLRRETWGRILHQLAGKAAFLAQLLDGGLPPEIEDVFFAAGARLFPHGDNDVRSRCTCPDPVVPCKHVAAVHFILADALQRDPFLLFALRGKSRDQFLQDLRDMRGRESGRRDPMATPTEDLGRFWHMGRLAESVLRPTGWGSGGDPARLVQSLGEPQLEGIREGLFLPMLESTYRQVSEGMRRLPKDG